MGNEGGRNGRPHYLFIVILGLVCILSGACVKAWESSPAANSQPSLGTETMNESFSPGDPGGSSTSTAPCTDAPSWLVDAIGDGILVRGAYLSNVYIGPASGFTSGPPELLSDAFGEAWWVAARLNGAEVQPVLAVWVTNRTTPNAAGQIYAANPAASRYTEWGAGVSAPIVGDGLQNVQSCVGPMPST